MLPAKTIETHLIFEVRARCEQSRKCNFGISVFLLYDHKNKSLKKVSFS